MTTTTAPRGADTVTTALALTLCALEIVARGAVAAYVLARSVRRAIATSAAVRRQPAPYVAPLFDLLAPLSCAQLRTALGAKRHESAVRLAALAVL